MIQQYIALDDELMYIFVDVAFSSRCFVVFDLIALIRLSRSPVHDQRAKTPPPPNNYSDAVRCTPYTQKCHGTIFAEPTEIN